MLQLNALCPRNEALSVLCLGAHSDDIEIGCGGTILRLLSTCENCHVTWVVLSAAGQRRREALSSARRFLGNARKKTVVTKQFKESFFPYRGEEIKGFFERLKKRVSPDLIFTHYRHDLHQDHRVVSDLTWNTFRHHQILEFEIPKYDGDLGQPNVFVPLTQSICNEKVGYLMDEFPSQRSRQWFSRETFHSILRLRGIESNAPSNYAEAFYGRKIVLG
ncbi:MAG: PIG-L family deacetylase [Nitrospira sp.]|jgi:LmbE family N-acetylglucosaminyl deacetylase